MQKESRDLDSSLHSAAGSYVIAALGLVTKAVLSIKRNEEPVPCN